MCDILRFIVCDILLGDFTVVVVLVCMRFRSLLKVVRSFCCFLGDCVGGGGLDVFCWVGWVIKGCCIGVLGGV